MRAINHAYRVKASIPVVIRDKDGHSYRELPAGSIFCATGSRPDPNGMIDGTCQGQVMLVFARDLETRAERMSGARVRALRVVDGKTEPMH